MPIMCEECKCSNWNCPTCGESNHHDCDCDCCGCPCQKGNSDNSDNSEAESGAFLFLTEEKIKLLGEALRIAINNFDFDGDYESSKKVEEILTIIEKVNL